MSYYGTHNRLARIALEKVENDNYLNGLDRTQWYKIPNLNHLADLKEKFLELNEDGETTSFINDCFAKSEYFFTQLFHSVVMSVLKWVMAITSINGLLQRGSMFVFSEQQFSQLIDFPTSYGGVKLRSLLDLGAGDGAVTSRMAPFFENVYATEMSYTMQWRLQQKGFKLLDVNDWDKVIDTNPESSENSDASNEAIKSPRDYNNASIIDIEHSTSSPHLKYDVISCLNLLDRCDKPISTLRKIKRTLNPNGLLIVALVLPFKPYVEYNKSNRPDERLFEFYDFENRKEITVAETYADKLDCVDDDMSCGVKTVKMGKIPSQIDYLIEQVFKPVGFELVRFSKLPYLCEGNLYQSFFYMFDYVFVFKSV